MLHGLRGSGKLDRVKGKTMVHVPGRRLVKWSFIFRSPVSDGRKMAVDEFALKLHWIFRKLPWLHAQQLIEEGKLYLANVRCWKDPNEAGWCDQIFRAGKLAGVEAYGQCWSEAEFLGDAWRKSGDSKEMPLVALKAGRSTLQDAMHFALRSTSVSIYLGSVRYWDDRKLKRLMKKPVPGQV